MPVQCQACGLLFYNRFQLGPHRRVCAARTSTSTGNGNDSGSTNGSASSVNNTVTRAAAVNVVAVPGPPVQLHVLAQRPARTGEPWGRVVPCARRSRHLRLELVRDYLPVSA